MVLLQKGIHYLQHSSILRKQTIISIVKTYTLTTADTNKQGRFIKVRIKLKTLLSLLASPVIKNQVMQRHTITFFPISFTFH